MPIHFRAARPVRDLHRSAEMYQRGLGLDRIGHFLDHEGFDGIMLGREGADYHFELTHCRTHPVSPAPTPEDLFVFYLPDLEEWKARCASMLAAGFLEVEPFNPYWGQSGRTFEDLDGYRVVLQCSAWTNRRQS